MTTLDDLEGALRDGGKRRRLTDFIAVLALVLAIANSAAVAFAFASNRDRQQDIARVTVDNCVRIHRIVVAGMRVIDPRGTRLRALLKAGRITRQQYDQALARASQSPAFKRARESLKVWLAGDCKLTKPEPLKRKRTSGRRPA